MTITYEIRLSEYGGGFLLFINNRYGGWYLHSDVLLDSLRWRIMAAFK